MHQLSMAMHVERFGVGVHEVSEHLAIDDRPAKPPKWSAI
jgi:hypothetical protein